MPREQDYPTNPAISTAMNVAEVSPNVDYVSYKPGDRSTVVEGTFTSEATYDEDDFLRWTATARKLGETTETLISLDTIGITKTSDGEWSDVVTIHRD